MADWFAWFAENMADWFVALATIILGIIAVFQDKIRDLIKAPQLKCTIELKPPDCHRTIMRGENVSFYAFYYLFRIWNKGNISAKNVEVIVSDIYKKEGNNFKEFAYFFPDNLKWSLAGQEAEVYCKYLSPGTFKHINLGHILDPQFRTHEDNPDLPVSKKEAIFCFDVNFRSNNLSYLVSPGTYQFTITIGCENAKSVKKRYILQFSGQWFEDESRMLNEGLNIREA